ncbi:MAG: hypothetical protein BGO67_11325 [Alphaproteobacteria bacterium 41-28]|nr:MAG: hypothetical protein BGO67_11325 [Alphaproteobacteria bacterium 41-28]
MLRELKFFLCFLFCVSIISVRADVLPIQSFKTPSGLEVWLVEDNTSPVISLVFKFDRAKLRSPFKPETSLFHSAILTGAGILSPLEMDRFSKETPAWASLEIGISQTTLTLKTTKDGLASSLKVWARLIGDPQFQKADLSYSKTRAISSVAYYKEDLELSSSIKLLQTIFPDSSFKIDLDKTSQIIESLTAEDMKKETITNFLSSKPKIVVVGDVNKKELIELLEATFGALDLHLPSSPPNSLNPRWSNKEILIERDVPQSVVAFAQPGVNPLSKDYPKFLLLQYVLYQRLYDELREKRGLIYSIQFNAGHYKNVDLLQGIFACECTNAPKVAKFIRSEWERLKDFGITQTELSSAKLAFKRDKILTLTSTKRVAKEYADPLSFNLSPDKARTLLETAEKVTLGEINLFTEEVLQPKSLTLVIIGRSSKSNPPKGKK